MTDSNRRRLVGVAAICAVMACACGQKRVASSFEELEPRLKAGQSIHVTTIAGDVRKARVETVSAGVAHVSISGASVEIRERDTAQITIPEPLWQGIIIGGSIGAALGSTGQQVAEGLGCFGSPDDCRSTVPVAGLLIGAGVGSAIGAGIDALVWRRKRVFSAAGATPARVALAPLARNRARGLRVTVIF